MLQSLCTGAYDLWQCKYPSSNSKYDDFRTPTNSREPTVLEGFEFILRCIDQVYVYRCLSNLCACMCRAIQRYRYIHSFKRFINSMTRFNLLQTLISVRKGRRLCKSRIRSNVVAVAALVVIGVDASICAGCRNERTANTLFVSMNRSVPILSLLQRCCLERWCNKRRRTKVTPAR